MKLKIFVSAYACELRLSSEFNEEGIRSINTKINYHAGKKDTQKY